MKGRKATAELGSPNIERDRQLSQQPSCYQSVDQNMQVNPAGSQTGLSKAGIQIRLPVPDVRSGNPDAQAHQRCHISCMDPEPNLCFYAWQGAALTLCPRAKVKWETKMLCTDILQQTRDRSTGICNPYHGSHRHKVLLLCAFMAKAAPGAEKESTHGRQAASI